MTAKVYYADLWGLREVYDEDGHGERTLTGGKYHWLWQNDVTTTGWTELEPESPHYLFIPQDADVRDEYQHSWKLTDVMPVSNVGFVSARDFFVVDFDRDELSKRIETFRSPEREISTEEVKEKFGLKDTSSWNVSTARDRLRAKSDWESDFTECLYRPFDVRHIYYSTDVLERPVYQIQQHMLLNHNLGISTTRSIEIGRGWEHIFCTSHIIQHHTVSLKEVNYLFPLYLYPTGKSTELFGDKQTDTSGGRRANLAPEFITEFAARLKMSFVADGRGDLAKNFGPEAVFNYMYAVFHSPAYRARYAEFLKIDFPRLPLTSQAPLFRRLCELGARLVALHLMEEHAHGAADFPAAGSNTVEQVRYTAPGEHGHAEGRVWINRDQYFANVAPEVWNFHVGGYQVCQKWLKDRKGRTLSYDDLSHYRRVVAALAETIRLMADIDATIDAHGGWPLR
jgi:predicted helicase